MKRTSLRLEAGEDGGKIPGPFDHGTGGAVDVDLEFIGDDVGQRGFPEARASMEEHVVQGLGTSLGRLDEDPEVRLISSCPTYSSRLFGLRLISDGSSSMFRFWIDNGVFHINTRPGLSGPL